jgi:branched-chain amino acid transport system ATP-binding protein
MSLLETRELSKSFAGLKAVEGVDFSLAEGEVRALIGPNGAGKTTFVGLICGRITPSRGTVHFGGQDITKMPAHARIRAGMAYTFQITSVFPGLPVLENVALAARQSLNGPEAEVAAQDALTRVGLGDQAQKDAGDMAYGHQRLLEIAMGLVQNPRLLILDEPTQGLTDSEIESFVAMIRGLKAQTTVLLIEHNMSVVMEAADQVTVMEFGEILAEGTPEAIRADAAVQAAYLGTG